MNIKVCDICYYEDGSKNESKYRTGYKGGSKIDVCEKHKQFGKGLTREGFYAKLSKLQTKHWEEELKDVHPKKVELKIGSAVK